MPELIRNLVHFKNFRKVKSLRYKYEKKAFSLATLGIDENTAYEMVTSVAREEGGLQQLERYFVEKSGHKIDPTEANEIIARILDGESWEKVTSYVRSLVEPKQDTSPLGMTSELADIITNTPEEVLPFLTKLGVKDEDLDWFADRVEEIINSPARHEGKFNALHNLVGNIRSYSDDSSIEAHADHELRFAMDTFTSFLESPLISLNEDGKVEMASKEDIVSSVDKVMDRLSRYPPSVRFLIREKLMDRINGRIRTMFRYYAQMSADKYGKKALKRALEKLYVS